MVYTYNEIGKITYDDYLKIVSINKENKNTIKKFLKYDDRLRHELCIYLLKMNINNNLFNTFKYNKKGKPLINEYKISFSKSNNGVIIGIDKVDIGVDIEDYSKKCIITKNLFLSEKEIKLINNSKDYIFFINAKEAYLKSKGQGLIDDIYKLDYSKYYKKNIFKKNNRVYNYFDKGKYSYLICSKHIQQIKKITYEELRRSLYEF